MAKFETTLYDGVIPESQIEVLHPKGVSTSNPFAPIHLKALTTDAGVIPGKALFIQGIDGDGNPEDIHIHTHSDAYLPISNRKAFETGQEIMTATGVDFHAQRMIWNGKKYIAEFIADTWKADVLPGDAFALGLQVQNSYDHSLVFGVQYFLCRLLCTNGMYVREQMGGFSFKHLKQNGDLIADATQRVMLQSAQLPELAQQFTAMTKVPAGLPMAQRWLSQMVNGTPKFPRSNVIDVLDAIEQPEIATVWDLYNAFTQVTSHELNPFTAPELSNRVSNLALAEVASATDNDV